MISISELELLKELFPEETRSLGEKEREEGIKEGKEEGKEIRSVEIAKSMKNFGNDYGYISTITGLSLEDIEKYKKRE